MDLAKDTSDSDGRLLAALASKGESDRKLKSGVSKIPRSRDNLPPSTSESYKKRKEHMLSVMANNLPGAIRNNFK